MKKVLSAFYDIITLHAPCISEKCFKMKINVYFHTSLWCLKRFYQDLKRLPLRPVPGLEGLTMVFLDIRIYIKQNLAPIWYL